VRHAARHAGANSIDFRHIASLRRKADAVCLAYSSSRILVGDRWYERFYDPLEPAFAAHGIRSLHLELQHHYLVPRYAPSRFIQLALDFRYSVQARRARPSFLHLPAYSAFLEHLAGLGVDERALRPEVLASRHVYLESAATYFEAILRRVGARLGFLEDFGLLPMAFILACRRRGIPSVELQHGVQGPLHFAYSRWTRIPPDGYELLPAVYWTWSSFEASTIGEWTKGRERWHRPLVGGNLFADEWRRLSSAVAADRDGQAIDGILDSDQVRVLVTLQKGIHPDYLAPLAAAIRSAPPGYRWWLRLHPAMDSDEARVVVERLDPGDGSVEVESAASRPLFDMLRQVDVHATFHSSVVLEAEQFGVPSVAFSHEAPGLYPEQMATGWLLCAHDGPGLLAALRAQAARVAALPRQSGGAPAPTETIRLLLEGAD
jgi:hypothetical protein